MAGVALSLIAMERRAGERDFAETTNLALEREMLAEFLVGEDDFFFYDPELTAFFYAKDFPLLASLTADAFFF